MGGGAGGTYQGVADADDEGGRGGHGAVRSR